VVLGQQKQDGFPEQCVPVWMFALNSGRHSWPAVEMKDWTVQWCFGNGVPLQEVPLVMQMEMERRIQCMSRNDWWCDMSKFLLMI
jgi:hypothetical protein